MTRQVVTHPDGTPGSGPGSALQQTYIQTVAAAELPGRVVMGLGEALGHAAGKQSSCSLLTPPLVSWSHLVLVTDYDEGLHRAVIMSSCVHPWQCHADNWGPGSILTLLSDQEHQKSIHKRMYTSPFPRMCETCTLVKVRTHT